MSNITSNATVTLTVNGKQAQDMLDSLKKKSQDLEKAIDNAARSGNKQSLSFKRSFILHAQSSKAETTFIGFTSTSMERKMAVDFAAAHTGKKNNETDVLFVIKGKNGHQIEDFSQFGGRYEGKQNQKEVLFDKGSKFKFECMQEEDGLPVFYLTEI